MTQQQQRLLILSRNMDFINLRFYIKHENISARHFFFFFVESLEKSQTYILNNCRLNEETIYL